MKFKVQFLFTPNKKKKKKKTPTHTKQPIFLSDELLYLLGKGMGSYPCRKTGIKIVTAL